MCFYHGGLKGLVILTKLLSDTEKILTRVYLIPLRHNCFDRLFSVLCFRILNPLN